MRSREGDISDKIDIELKTLKKTGGVISYGTYKKIADKYGVSKELVRQIAKIYRFKITSLRRSKKRISRLIKQTSILRTR